MLHELLLLLAAFGQAQHAQSKGNILINTFWEWIRLLENHADFPPQIGQVVTRSIDIFTIEQDQPLYARIGDAVVHAVQAAQEGRFTTSRRAD